MKYSQLLEQIKQELIHFFKANSKAGFIYHSQEHTQSVVTRSIEIGNHYKLNERELFIITTAAWFHDIGYYNGGALDHELRGADKAELFLKEKDVDKETIEAVRGCIIATRYPQTPHNLLEQIVCDADLYHLGTGEFFVHNKEMRKEAKMRSEKKISKGDWRKSTITFLESHHYHTDYTRGVLGNKKKQNLEELKKKEGGTIAATALAVPVPLIESVAQEKQQAATAKKQKSDRPERGIETMFRVSSSNHQRLSDMADNKSHIMITTTSIIISVLLSVLLRKLEDNPHLVIPTLLLLAVCVTTMVFSILATRPTLPPGTFTQEDMNAKKVNLLFFGNFYRMSYEEYDDGMKKVMSDRDFLYGSLTRDVYSQGKVLGRKYRLLRIGYNIFMYGVVASVLSFVIAVVFFK
ncbi:MAG: Pycsar system effector family protein [Chitinophagaceae bacterium]